MDWRTKGILDDISAVAGMSVYNAESDGTITVETESSGYIFELVMEIFIDLYNDNTLVSLTVRTFDLDGMELTEDYPIGGDDDEAYLYKALSDYYPGIISIINY